MYIVGIEIGNNKLNINRKEEQEGEEEMIRVGSK